MKNARLLMLFACFFLAACETLEPNGAPYNCDTAYSFCKGNAHDPVATQRCEEDYNRCKNRP